MGSRVRERAALAAKPPGVHRNHPDGNVPFRRAGPDQRNKPADDRPAGEQVHEENSHEVGLVPRQYCREEVKDRGEKKEGHVFTLSALTQLAEKSKLIPTSRYARTRGIVPSVNGSYHS